MKERTRSVIAESWKGDRAPCCLCIFLFVEPSYIWRGAEDYEGDADEAVYFEELGETLTLEQMEERIEEARSCCGEEVEEHHADCNYYGEGITPLIEIMREARDMDKGERKPY